jgi:hypothetical protein
MELDCPKLLALAGFKAWKELTLEHCANRRSTPDGQK